MDEVRDRLVEILLREIVGGETPPDLSDKILQRAFPEGEAGRETAVAGEDLPKKPPRDVPRLVRARRTAPFVYLIVGAAAATVVMAIFWTLRESGGRSGLAERPSHETAPPPGPEERRTERPLEPADVLLSAPEIASIPANMKTRAAASGITPEPETMEAPLALSRRPRQAEALIAEAEGALAAGDLAGARAAISRLDRLGIEEGRVAREALLRRIADAERAAKLRAEEENRRLLALLDEFCDLVGKGDPGGARERLEAAAMMSARHELVTRLASARQEGSSKAREGREETPSALRLRAAVRVARALEERQAAVRTAAQGLTGKDVALETKAGTRRGTVEEVSPEGIVLVQRAATAGGAYAEMRFTVPWQKLAPAESDRLAGEWRPEGPDGELARSLLALRRRDPDSAQRALEAAGEHPLGGWLRGKVAGLRLEAAETAARAAWKGIEGKASAQKLSQRSAKALLSGVEAFEREHGESEFAASVADRLTGIRARAKEAALPKVGVPTGENLLAGPGFEGECDQWGKLASGARSVVDTPTRSGERAHQIVVEGRYYVEVYQVVRVTGGAVYEAGGWVRTDRVGGGGAAISIMWLRSGEHEPDFGDAEGLRREGALLRTNTIGTVTGTRDWTCLWGRFVAPENARFARFRFFANPDPGGSGRAWFDDLHFGRYVRKERRP